MAHCEASVVDITSTTATLHLLGCPQRIEILERRIRSGHSVHPRVHGPDGPVQSGGNCDPEKGSHIRLKTPT